MTQHAPLATATAAAPALDDPLPRTNGADLVLRTFEAEGVEVCFGIPGGAILPIYDAIARGTTVRHVLARHEQGAGHMAEGYARASGSPGVVLATSGPGATNLVTPIANAAMDSTPLVCVTGQVDRALIGTDAFQECDIVSVARPLVKGCWQVRDVGELAATLHEAFALARSGRPGPVLVDVPRDVQKAPVEGAAAPLPARPADPPPAAPDAAGVAAIARAIERAARPVLYVGGGAINADASPELRALAEHARIPVVTTLMAKGAIPAAHELDFGCPGMHGGRWANLALDRADLVIAVGARFDDRVTGRLADFAPAATVAHLDVDPREIGKLRHVELPLLGELKPALVAIRDALGTLPDTAPWLAQLRAWREQHPLRYDEASPALKPQRVLERVVAALGEREVVWATGVGQHQMWAMQYLPCQRPRTFLTSGGHGTMGYGLPAAVGASAARPDATVVCVDGDGSFQMTAQELATAVAERLPVIVVILDNEGLGMVQQWQSMFYEGRRSHSDLSEPADCARVARGFGAAAATVRSEAELNAALAEALASGGVTVLDVLVDREERCYPIVRPGGSAVDMLEWPGDE